MTQPIARDAIYRRRAFDEPGPDESRGKVRLAALQNMVIALQAAVADGFINQACQSWRLSKRQVQAFFSAATPISSEQRHSAYESMPCAYEGTLQSGRFVYEYSINAGLHGYLRELNGPEREFYFGCKDKCVSLTPFNDLYEEDQ